MSFFLVICELGWEAQRRRVEQWYREHRLSRFVSALVPCVPAPCTERWLCLGAGLTHKSKRTTRPCDPWKEAWEKPALPERRRLPKAVERLLARPPPELIAFLDALE